MRRTTTTIAAAVLLVAAQAPATAAEPGSLDRSFSGDGRAQLGFGGGYDDVVARDLVVLVGGKVLTVAPLTKGDRTTFGIARLKDDGSPDPRFSQNGRRTVAFTGNDVPRRVITTGGGRVLVGGSAGGAFGLVTLYRDGAISSTFGTDGKVVTDVTDGVDQVLDLRLQPDGSILAAGVAGAGFAVARYRADGTPDDTFGDGGVVVTTEPFAGEPNMLRLQPDGKLVVVGVSEPNENENRGYAVARYDVDGSLDETFGGGDGQVTTHVGEMSGQVEDTSRANAVLVEPDGRIVVAGSSFGDGDYRRWSMARYLPDGTLDTTFGNGGVVWHFFEPYYAAIYALARQGDGRIVAAGWTDRLGDSAAVAVGRYTADGDLDPAFSGDGKALVAFGQDRAGESLAVATRKGRIVTVGTVRKLDSVRRVGVVVRLHQ